MSLRLAAERAVQHGRFLLRLLYRRPGDTLSVASHPPTARLLLGPPAPARPPSALGQVRRLLVDNLLRRVTNSFAAQLRRKAAKQLLFGNPTPFFALVGVSLASGTGIITKEEEMEGICWEIRDAVSKLPWVPKEQDEPVLETGEKTISLDDLEIGQPIAKGCNAVVYAGRWKQATSEEPQVVETATEPQHNKTESDEYPLAVKMMFNYSVESNALSILRAMHHETVPAQATAVRQLESWEASFHDRSRYLPPHPNIVDMRCVFADAVPQLPESMMLYPEALPYRLNPAGFGHNMSLFLVMRRYHSSLQTYVEQERSVRTGILILTQLLEGVSHMVRNEVAHRDLKADNILIDVELGDDSPQVAIADFGCCLSDRVHGLRLPYHSPETEKGGNPALMAPEVATAMPGPFTTIDYTKADAWTVGAVSYQIMGAQNPFYLGTGEGQRLDSRTYNEDELPELPEHVPDVIKDVIYGLLERSPSQRLSAEMASTVCQLFLWAPSAWLHGGWDRIPSAGEVLQWLLCLTTKTLCEGAFPRKSQTQLEYRLVATFLKRARLSTVMEALRWMHRRE